MSIVVGINPTSSDDMVQRLDGAMLYWHSGCVYEFTYAYLIYCKHACVHSCMYACCADKYVHTLALVNAGSHMTAWMHILFSFWS